MTRKFRTDYGVFVCGHVFRKERPTLLVIRDPDGQWQFLCGKEGCIEENDGHLVGVGHLLERDSTPEKAVELESGQCIERETSSSSWVRGNISNEF
jgi:hypothetical protein